MPNQQLPLKLGLAVILSLFTIACAPIRNSPFSEQTLSNARNINLQSSSQVMMLDSSATLRIGLLSDSHANHDDLKEVVHRFNSSALDFVVNLGDMTDLGLADEYDLFLSKMADLQTPWFSVIGNHDAVGNGELIYRKHFGDFNFKFDLAGYRFIMFNNNQLDFLPTGIDFDWLDSQVLTSPYPVILFQHVDPTNTEYFTDELQERYRKLFRSQKIAQTFHGHKHVFTDYEMEGSPIQGIARTQGIQYSILEISSAGIKITNYSGDKNEVIENNLQHLNQ